MPVKKDGRRVLAKVAGAPSPSQTIPDQSVGVVQSTTETAFRRFPRTFRALRTLPDTVKAAALVGAGYAAVIGGGMVADATPPWLIAGLIIGAGVACVVLLATVAR